MTVPPSCTNCYSYATSTYTVFEDQVDWKTARDNCYSIGGKLAELETKGENDFIKNTLTVRNSSAADAYFLGGYKLNPSDGFRWISTPSQSWTFKDFGTDEPSNPTEMCLGSFLSIGFQWADVPCDWLRSYICEFSD
ncbi:Hypothetical predicted protein [Mytilus galloprovincialis]|uniref:C-type lectin domain-containing protein n=1 Tax=Mytilus galloprovincialis TaxID=29158 RepID=A0A8B6DIV6_MYTGA|nr:Hypothetical predicted protein [Mytilus galloprovincialis]